ncbi:hypothetical protein [Actinokineospora sp. NPDC004072]
MTDQPPGHQPPGYQPSPAGEPTPPRGFPASPYQGTGSYPGSGGFPAQNPGSGPFPAPTSGGFPAQTPGSGAFPAQNPGSGAFPAQPGYPGAQPKRKAGTAVVALAAALVVFAAAAGVMLFLWLGAADDAKAHNDKLSGLSGELVSTQKKAEEAKESAADSAAKADAAGKDADVLKSEISGLRRCADKVRQTLIAAESGTDEELRSAVQLMFQNC